MTLWSVLKRISMGPTIHKLVCYRVTEQNLNFDMLCLENISIEELSRDSCDKVDEIRENEVRCAFERMAEDSSTVVLAKWCGNIAGHAVLKPRGKRGYQAAFWKNKAYIHYCFVAPQFRGQGIYPYMLTYLTQKAFENQGEKNVFISADFKNYSSIRGIVKAGFEYWGDLTEYGWGEIIFLRRLKRKRII